MGDNMVKKVCFNIDGLSIESSIFIQRRMEVINDRSYNGDVLHLTNFEGNVNSICGEQEDIDTLLDKLRATSHEIIDALLDESRISTVRYGKD